MVVNHLQVNSECSTEVLNVFLMLEQHNYSHVVQIFSRVENLNENSKKNEIP